MTLDRSAIIEAILSQLSHDRDAVLSSARAAHAAATHEESKAEDSHDTRGLEASYLAGAQAKRVQELDQQIAVVKQFARDPLPPGSTVRVGACVELEISGRRTHYFVASLGGGITVRHGDLRIQVITPRAPLGEALLDRKAGDRVTVESEQGEREYLVRAVL